MIYDLHTHSALSDGILSPEDLVSSAKLAGVTHLALTDHDSVAGLDRAGAACVEHGITLITGIEISTEWRGRGIHIVGLNVEVQNSSLQTFIQQQGQARQLRAEQIGQKLEKLGVPGALQGALALANGGTVGRPHFAQYLVSGGFVPNFNAAFKRYLGAGKPGDIKQCWSDIPTAISAIHAAGGIAVLAHPLKYDMTRTKLAELLYDFREAGGQAMEILSGKQKPNDTNALVSLAKKWSMLGSCGSDFHAPGQPWQALGAFGCLPKGLEPVWSGF